MIEAKPRSLPGRLSAFSPIYYFDHELYTSVCSTFRFVSQNNFFQRNTQSVLVSNISVLNRGFLLFYDYILMDTKLLMVE